MKPLCATVLGLVVFVANGAVRADDADKLIGKWEITKSDNEAPVGTVVEFMKDGKMKAVVKHDGADLNLTGTYKLDGKKLSVKLMLGDEKIEHDYTITFKDKDETLEMADADKKVATLKKKK